MSSRAFTLIEVLISVMLIVVVVGSLWKILSNNSNILKRFEKKSETMWASSLMLSLKDRGFKEESLTLAELAENFKIRDELRAQLKERGVALSYSEIAQIDTAEILDWRDKQSSDAKKQNYIFELGRSAMRVDGESTLLYRVRLQQ